MTYRITYHPEAEAELDRLYADIVAEAGDRIAGDYVVSATNSPPFLL